MREDSGEAGASENFKFDEFSAFCVLFSISFCPAIIVVDLVTRQAFKEKEMWVTIAIIGIAFLINMFSTFLLTQLAGYQKNGSCGSYQEMAYHYS
jgi:uncharacterized membrane protein